MSGPFSRTGSGRVIDMSVHYAAIGAGALAIVTVLIYIIHRHRRRRTSRSIHSSTSLQHTPKTTGSSGLGGVFGYPRSPPHSSSHGHTNPDTPSSHESSGVPTPPAAGGRLKKSNSAPKARTQPPAVPAQEETEMVMVTYEEGLKKLGLDKKQHLIYPEPPIDFDSLDAPTPGLSAGSSRPTPTTAQLLSPSKSGLRPPYARQPSDSPHRSRSDGSPRTKIGRTDDSGRFPTDSELLTTGVPSYYHQASAAVRGRPDSPPSAYSGTR